MTAPAHRVIVTGSIANDELMTFPGRFADQILEDKLSVLSLSFLVDDLSVRRGGVAANIAYGIARLGSIPVLVGAAGADFDVDYRPWLHSHGVETRHVRISDSAHTARFICTTDQDLCQIAAFYPGAMTEAALIDLEAVVGATGVPDLVFIGPDIPEAMLRHADTCRRRGWRFAADPSQQLARMTAHQAVTFVSGAAFLFTNEYEHGLLLAKTGLTRTELGALVEVIVTTLGADGVRIIADGEATTVPAAPVPRIVDPTGGGDAFRAGFISALGRGLSLAAGAELGCRMAALALQTNGTQEYEPMTQDVRGLIPAIAGH